MSSSGGGGRILGVDHGSRRVGVAVSDSLHITAQPLEVVERNRAVARIVELASRYEVDTIVVGLPTSLDGTERMAATAARAFAADLGAATGLPVEMVDERFTSSTAEKVMLEGGIRRRRRRQNIDKVAAAIILQTFLDRSR
ncbi:MAG: Holliday junction resolvase RuvX [Actinomycetota bacterium]